LTQLVRQFAASEINYPFRFNAFYPEAEVPEIEEADFELEIAGLADNKASWTLAQLRALPQEQQITQHICIEGWSQIGSFGGVPFAQFLDRIGADKRARYVAFQCADGYSTSIDMATARHPQTLMALEMNGKTILPRHGYPFKLRVPTKLGFKNPKHITAIEVTNEYKDGFWEAYGYNWFSGL
jgi:DMSO/TMAO reductase YedYZ molybdopterin-dependent catalytic subunit